MTAFGVPLLRIVLFVSSRLDMIYAGYFSALLLAAPPALKKPSAVTWPAEF